MNIWLILTTEIKHVLRNRSFLVMMVLFPLILMLILGTALSGAFQRNAPVQEIRMLYRCSGQSQSARVFQYFVAQGDRMGIRFTSARSLARGVAGIQKGKADVLIVGGDQGFRLYQNNRSVFRASLALAMFQGFVQRYQAIAAIAQLKSARAAQIMRNEVRTERRSNLVVDTALNGARKPRAIDYYAVTMLTLIIMYSTISGSYAIKREILGRTANRLRCCPVKNHEILIGKIGGAIGSALLQVFIVVMVSKYLFHAYWGEHPAAVGLLLFAEVAMAISLGIGCAFLIRNQVALNGFLNLLIPVVAFLGGGYIPIDSFGPVFLHLADLSPLRWINKAIFAVIYNHDFHSVCAAVLVNLSVAAVFIGIISWAARKETFLK